MNFIERTENVRKRNIFTCIAIFFYHMFLSFRYFGNLDFLIKPSKKYLFFVSTQNGWNAQSPLTNGLQEKIITGNNLKNENLIPHYNRVYPLYLAYLLCLPYLPKVLFCFLKSSGYSRQSFNHFLHNYALVCGHYILARFYLRHTRPKVVILSNDHHMWARVFRQAANEEGIKTVYIQHASVSKLFPPLEFDYALLEGRDALNKYLTAGPTNTNIFLIGIPRLSEYMKNRKFENNFSHFGIGINRLDPLKRVDELCKALLKKIPSINLTLRPHPADLRLNSWKELVERLNLNYSNPAQESPVDFLKGIDAIIVGESNISLEAALMNVSPIYYDFPQQKMDNYDFIKQGILKYHSEPDEIITVIEKLQKNQVNLNLQDRFKYYCETLETPYEGKATELATRILLKIGNGKNPSELNFFTPLTSTECKQYAEQTTVFKIKQ